MAGLKPMTSLKILKLDLTFERHNEQFFTMFSEQFGNISTTIENLKLTLGEVTLSVDSLSIFTKNSQNSSHYRRFIYTFQPISRQKNCISY